MHKAQIRWFGFLVLTFLLVSLACSSVAPAAAPTAPPPTTQAPPTLTATATMPPTSTPEPTATPDVAATKEIEDFQALLSGYVDAGYIPPVQGTLYDLADYKMEWAQINYLSDLTSTGYDKPVKNFLFTGDFEWDSAVQNPETSGCGLYFRYQESGSFYSVYLDTERVVMGGYDGSIGPYVTRFGITKGSGRVNLERPAKANFTLILNGNMAYVLVNGSFTGSYTLYTGKLMDPGYLAYFIKSGTNKDYGTRCSITNARLWIPEE